MGIKANYPWSSKLVASNLHGKAPMVYYHGVTGKAASKHWRREYYRRSTPEQISLDLGTLRKNWKLMQKLRLSDPRDTTLGERVEHWTAARQTLHSRSTARRKAQRIRCHFAQTATFLREPPSRHCASNDPTRAIRLFSFLILNGHHFPHVTDIS